LASSIDVGFIRLWRLFMSRTRNRPSSIALIDVDYLNQKSSTGKLTQKNKAIEAGTAWKLSQNYRIWRSGLSQKTNLCLRHEILFSFFNSNKKLQSNFLLELKKENIFLRPGARPVF